jgi:hypothetical protein
MNPHAARSAGQADTAESTLTRPLRSATHVCVRSRVGTVRWSPSMHLTDTWILPCPAHHSNVGVWTTPSSRALHMTPNTVVPLCRMSACSLYRHDEPSPPSSLLAQLVLLPRNARL